MITFIYGGSSSGKSAFAEDYVLKLGINNKYYLATMSANDTESLVRIQKHRLARQGKGFITIEQSQNISSILNQIENPSNAVVLLECMSNLVAGEMFAKLQPLLYRECADKIYNDITALAENIYHLVIVSNNVFEDGAYYDDSTREYMRALGTINRRVAAEADDVFEVVVGIGVKL